MAQEFATRRTPAEIINSRWNVSHFQRATTPARINGSGKSPEQDENQGAIPEDLYEFLPNESKDPSHHLKPSFCETQESRRCKQPIRKATVSANRAHSTKARVPSGK